MRRLAGVVLVLFAVAGSVGAAELPPGKWWRRPEIIQSLALTTDQQTKLDRIFRTNANELIDLRGAVEKEAVALRSELDQPQLNRTNIQRVAAQLNEARGKLFAHELMLLVDMRAVLSDEQWTRMRDRLNSEVKRPNRRER
ncbi:MAG: periplasmic heavy metal sensor [Acidobacteriota bacterium]